jgi:hypothetical protein
VFDDYAWDQVMEHLPPKKCPRMAIDAFLAMFKAGMSLYSWGCHSTPVVTRLVTRNIPAVIN